MPRLQSSPGDRNGFAGAAQHTLTYPNSSSAENFRAIRTNVYFSGQRGQIKSLMVTSVAPQDGKSVFASNLAAAIAQDGKRVLLVDADLRRPTVHQAYDVHRAPGLTNMLVEGTPLDDLVQVPAARQNGGPGCLHILSAGAKVPNPSELLGGGVMAAFMRQARERYDMVIYDCCPAMFVADAAGIAAGSDGAVLVLKASKTRRDAAESAARQLLAVDGKIIGAVLNQVHRRAMRYHGGYNYYYYDYQRYYHDYGEKDATVELLAPPAHEQAGGARAAVALQEPRARGRRCGGAAPRHRRGARRGRPLRDGRRRQQLQLRAARGRVGRRRPGPLRLRRRLSGQGRLQDALQVLAYPWDAPGGGPRFGERRLPQRPPRPCRPARRR